MPNLRLILRFYPSSVIFCSRSTASLRFISCPIATSRSFSTTLHPLSPPDPEPEKESASETPDNARPHSLLSILERRRLVEGIAGSRDDLETLLATQPIGAYCGVDPTARSMHIGNLLPLMVLFWLYLHGHHAYTLVGGATARIGDPSWRTTTRESKGRFEQANLASGIQSQMATLWSRIEEVSRTPQFASGPRPLVQHQVNNVEWLQGLSFIEIMGTMGRGMKLNSLLAKDSMKTRMWGSDAPTSSARRDSGLNLSELNYPALQAWDFWHLYSTRGVMLQVGGGDQYGNITTAIDGVQYMISHHAKPAQPKQPASPLHRPYGLTVPLLTLGSSKQKMGKSADNAVWLSPDMTSDFDLYQFFMRLHDAEVARYWKRFTFRPLRYITDLMAEHAAAPERRLAQRGLADEFLRLFRGPEAARRAQREHATVFARPHSSTPDAEAPPQPTAIPYPESKGCRHPVAAIFADIGLCTSKSQATRMIQAQGGLYYAVSPPPSGSDAAPGFEMIRDIKTFFLPHDAEPSGKPGEIRLAPDGLLMLRMGKWKVRVLRVVSDAEFKRLTS